VIVFRIFFFLLISLVGVLVFYFFFAGRQVPSLSLGGPSRFEEYPNKLLDALFWTFSPFTLEEGNAPT